MLLSLYTALRSLKLYPLENATVQKSLADLDTISRALLQSEIELEIRIAGDFIFVNSTRLRLELDNFSQQFDAPDRSRIVLRARATLVSGLQRTLIAQHEFKIERSAAPNAQGAVKALSEGTNAFLDELVKWVSDSVAKAGGTKS